MAKNDLPVLLCREVREKSGLLLWECWCPYCKRFHTHGAEAGHRVAHCDSGPFRDTGYILKRDRRFGRP